MGYLGDPRLVCEEQCVLPRNALHAQKSFFLNLACYQPPAMLRQSSTASNARDARRGGARRTTGAAVESGIHFAFAQYWFETSGISDRVDLLASSNLLPPRLHQATDSNNSSGRQHE